MDKEHAYSRFNDQFLKSLFMPLNLFLNTCPLIYKLLIYVVIHALYSMYIQIV